MSQPFDVGGSPRDFAAARQQRYDRRISRNLLDRVCGEQGSFFVVHTVRQAGEDFGLSWLMQRFPECPIALGCRRLDTSVNLSPQSYAKFCKTEIYKTYREVRQDYADRPFFGLVFDHHDDNVADLILHNATFLVNPSQMIASIPSPDGDEMKTLHAQQWPDFLTRLAERFQPG